MPVYIHHQEFPFNWDPQRVGIPIGLMGGLKLSCFHSIGIPSEWGLYHEARTNGRAKGFHSIGIPSEWGHSPYPA